MLCMVFKNKTKHLFICLHPVVVVARGIFRCGVQTFSCGMWDLVP